MGAITENLIGYGGGALLLGLLLLQSCGRYVDTLRDAKANNFPWWRRHSLAVAFVLNIWGMIFGFLYCIWLMINRVGWWGLLIYAVWLFVGMRIYTGILDSMPIKAKDIDQKDKQL